VRFPGRWLPNRVTPIGHCTAYYGAPVQLRRDFLFCDTSPSAAALVKGIKQLFKQEPDREWRDHIEAIAKKAI
jgi:hypothetical protein